MAKLSVFIVFFWFIGQSLADTDANTEPVAVKRTLIVVNRVQLTLPTITLLTQRDFLYHHLIGVNIRYYFSENHGWEIRGYYDSYSDTEMSFLEEDRQPMVSIASNYIFRPVFGQYLFSSSNLIQFDIYFLSGAGSKFSESIQPFLNFGIGSHHYIFKNKISLVPELLIRTYPNNAWYNELIFNAGISYLF